MVGVNNENLTQEEAEARSALLTVDTYDVHLDLTHAGERDFATYPVAATIRFRAQAGETTFLDYIHQSIDSVKLNGEHLNINEVVDGSRIVLPRLQDENIVTVMGRSYYSNSGEGLHRYFDPNDQKVYLYTQYEPADARRVFPNFEQPDLKAVFNFRITAPKSWVVSSNATLDKEIEDPADSSISKRVFKPTEKISTYITTVLAGEYFVASDLYTPTAKTNSGKIPLTAYCRQSLKSYFDTENIFAVTKQGLDFFQDLFDYPYPFHKYDQAFVPEYNLGAMENPGLVTFTESYIFESGATEAQLENRANVICHEMSHMWFGDLVTMKWWNDLWLKESFAEFMGTLGAHTANGFDQAWVTFANRRKAWAYNQDQLPTTHPIVADIPHLEAARQNFDGITYAKGSSVLKQLVAYVGFESFIRASREYFKRHAWGNTDLQDFLAVLDEATDRDVRAWAAAWLQTSGISTLSTRRDNDEDGALRQFSIIQQLPPGADSSLGRPHQLKLETFTAAEGKLVSSGLLEIQIPAGDSAQTPLNLNQEELRRVEEADLLVLNAEDLAYAKVVLSEEDGLSTALKLVSTLEDPLTRGLVWGSLWNQVRDASLPSRVFVHAVEHHLPQETSSTLLANLLSQAQAAIFSFSHLAQRQELADSLYSAISEALAQAPAGSDSQLILLRAALALAVHTDLGVELCQEVSRGAFETVKENISETPGLTTNQTLGWSALIALAARENISQQSLDEARTFSPSSISERGFACASAAFPTEQTKREAFQRVMADPELSNEILSATAQGFQMGPQELRDSFTTDFFDGLETIWESRSIGMASRIVNGLFPHALYSPEASAQTHPVVKATLAWLDSHQQATAALQREILEELDRTRRSLRAQEFNSKN
ncbi:aminopeptidase [Rothia aerolata]|uniref:Aminopeptidase N n=1 Tax=Rothia aerolata TaxID=1812262 RepID=A0A917IMT2_9MICC|nr:aminopeptidase [Rothia aerolata]